MRPISPEPKEPPSVRDHDPRAFDVAALVARLIVEVLPGVTVEHIGSSAVAGLPGKGVVDLLLPAAPADVPRIVGALGGLGFEPQSGGDPFPPTRPMLEGSITFDGTVFRLHCHVIPEGSEEIARLLTFRDRLRTEPELREAYAALKRQIVDAGVRDAAEYTRSKTEFVIGAVRAVRATGGDR